LSCPPVRRQERVIRVSARVNQTHLSPKSLQILRIFWHRLTIHSDHLVAGIGEHYLVAAIREQLPFRILRVGTVASSGASISASAEA
jgi:hypothetical protein